MTDQPQDRLLPEFDYYDILALAHDAKARAQEPQPRPQPASKD